MNLRGLANQVSRTVNPNILVTVKTSAGSTVGSAGRQIPNYNAPVAGPAQIQALDNSDLKKMEGLNIQGSLRALYMRGPLAGVIRPDSKGGDIVLIGSNSGAPALLQGTWLIVKVLESWTDWTKCVIQKQSLS
jgi:hypothetical protein